MLRTRVMTAPKASHAARAHPLVTLAAVAQREGLPALWVGVLPALVAMAPSGAIFFGLFDLLKSVHLKAEMQRTGGMHACPAFCALQGAFRACHGLYVIQLSDVGPSPASCIMQGGALHTWTPRTRCSLARWQAPQPRARSTRSR